MMKTVRLMLVGAAASLSLQAVSAPAGGTTNNVLSFVDADLSAVTLAVVDGQPLTAAAVKEAVLIAAKVKDLSNGKEREAPPSGRRANLTAMHLTPQLVSSLLLDAELDRRGIEASAASDAEIFARYNNKFKVKSSTPDELFARFGDLAPAFKRQFARESRYRAMFDSQPELKVTDEDVTNYFNGISNKIVKCERINRRATNQIARAWKELNEGRPWDVVATNYTEDALLDESLADNWKDWMSTTLNRIEPVELMTAVSRLKPGEFTRPIETDEGVVIVKLLELDGELYCMARILVRLAVTVEVPSREVAIRRIRKEKEVAFQKKTLTELKNNAKIDYPFGKKFAFQIWEEPVARQKSKKRGKAKPAEIKAEPAEIKAESAEIKAESAEK